jgi:hypothetical protein
MVGLYHPSAASCHDEHKMRSGSFGRNPVGNSLPNPICSKRARKTSDSSSAKWLMSQVPGEDDLPTNEKFTAGIVLAGSVAG